MVINLFCKMFGTNDSLFKLFMMEKILEQQWSYILYRDGDRLLLSVVCGDIAIYLIDIELNEAETKRYREGGPAYIEELAEEIMQNPWLYRPRRIELKS